MQCQRSNLHYLFRRHHNWGDGRVLCCAGVLIDQSFAPDRKLGPNSMQYVTQWRILSGAQIATCAGILVFWLIFFAIGIPVTNPPACYFSFELAFPLPDLVLAIALFVSAVDILKGRDRGHKISLACAGGLLFLSLIDISFSMQNGVFSGPAPDALLSASISIWCATLGLWIIVWHFRYQPTFGVGY